MEWKHWIAAGVLAAVWILETLRPFYRQFEGQRRQWLRHDLVNLALGALNAAASAVIVVLAISLLDQWAASKNLGLLRQFDLHPVAGTLLAIVVFDLWMYTWHWLNHRIPFFWRFHRMHHSDPQMDASTGVRFHIGEVCMSWMARAAVLPILGISLAQLAIYESILLPVVLFHHSNLRLPRWLDYGLLAVVVSPAMHRVHHSHLLHETNSNYGSIFPWWDRLFGSLRLRATNEDIRFGLDDLDEPQWQTVQGLLTTPLAERWRGREEGEP